MSRSSSDQSTLAFEFFYAHSSVNFIFFISVLLWLREAWHTGSLMSGEYFSVKSWLNG